MDINNIEIKHANVGITIQFYRKKYNISQSKLCKGLCSVATLSRIETGEREEDGLLLETLLERIGISPNKFEFILEASDYSAFQLRNKIDYLISINNYQAASDLLNMYIKVTKTKSNIHKQYIKKTQAYISEFEGTSIEETIKKLYESIIYTVPNLKENNLKSNYLSRSEINIIINIVRRLILIKKYDKSQIILKQLLGLIENHYSIEIQSDIYPEVAIILCNIYIKKNELNNALKICNTAFEILKSSITLEYRGELALIKARIIEKLFKIQNSKYNQDDIIYYFFQSYYIFLFSGEDNKAQNIKEYLLKEYKEITIL